MLYAIVLVAGLACAALGVVRRLLWRRARGRYANWPSTPGTITASSLRAMQRLDDHEGGSDVWFPVVGYRYAVEGVAHTGSRAFWFDRVFLDHGDAEAWLAAVPAGAQLPVRYDPAQPGRSALVLNCPATTPGAGLIWLGAALIAGGMLGPATQ